MGDSASGGDSSSVASSPLVLAKFSPIIVPCSTKRRRFRHHLGKSPPREVIHLRSLLLSSGVSRIFSQFGFAALKDDGSVITWPGSVSEISSLSSGVSQIFTQFQFLRCTQRRRLRRSPGGDTWEEVIHPLSPLLLRRQPNFLNCRISARRRLCSTERRRLRHHLGSFNIADERDLIKMLMPLLSLWC